MATVCAGVVLVEAEQDIDPEGTQSPPQLGRGRGMLDPCRKLFSSSEANEAILHSNFPTPHTVQTVPSL